MNNNVPFICLALITGSLIPVQAATNAVLNKVVGNSLFTALIAFTVGLSAVIAYMLLNKIAFPGWQKILGGPFYSYLGGVIIALYIVSISLVTQKLGVASAIGLIVTGQMLGAILIDNWGFFHMAIRKLDWSRMLGLAMIVGGVFLILRKR